MLPLNLSDTAATSQDGSSLEFIAAIAGRQCYIQDASGRGLCVRGHISGVKCIFLLLFFSKVVELVGGGSVINRAYPI